MIDGVIKFNVEHEYTGAPIFDAFEQLEALRTRLFTLGLIGETPDGIGYGNVSHRFNNDASFFITATQTGKQPSLTQDEYTFIERCAFDSFTVFSKGNLKPSSESLSHAMIYEVHPDIGAVIHVHSSALWQMMIDTNALATTAKYGTTGMVHEIASLYQSRNPFEHNAFVMKGHEDGIITFGKNIEEAELRLYHIIANLMHNTKRGT